MTERTGPEQWRDHYVHPCDWAQDFAPLALTELFAQCVARHRDRPFVEISGRKFTYRDINAEARRFAAGLQSMGIGKGDRIGLYLPNVPVYLSAYFGILMAGAVVVNFMPVSTAAALEAQIADSGTRLLVTLDAPALLDPAVEALRQSGLERLVVARLAAQLPFWKGMSLRLLHRRETVPLPLGTDILDWAEVLSEASPSPVSIDPLTDVALLQYTRGTTGVARGVMLTHQNLTANARQIELLDPHAHARDVIMGVLPLSGIFANAGVLNSTLCNGGMIALLPRFNARRALATIERVKATVMPGVPAMYQAMLDHPAIGRTDLSSLFTCVSGGEPLPPVLKTRFEKASGAKLVQGYGLTETAGVVAANPYDGREKPGSIGQPLPGTDVRLLDIDHPDRDAVPGEPGELAVCGPQVTPGFWNRPEATAQAFVKREGRRWLRTGDLAAIDEDGYVWIAGRLKAP